MACISRFAMAILSGETELALGTIRVKFEMHTFGTYVIAILSASFVHTSGIPNLQSELSKNLQKKAPAY